MRLESVQGGYLPIELPPPTISLDNAFLFLQKCGKTARLQGAEFIVSVPDNYNPDLATDILASLAGFLRDEMGEWFSFTVELSAELAEAASLQQFFWQNSHVRKVIRLFVPAKVAPAIVREAHRRFIQKHLRDKVINFKVVIDEQCPMRDALSVVRPLIKNSMIRFVVVVASIHKNDPYLLQFLANTGTKLQIVLTTKPFITNGKKY